MSQVREVTARVAGYECYLNEETFGPGDVTTYVHVTGKLNGREYTSSLEAAESDGRLDETVHISNEALDKIRSWAERNGY